MNIAEIVQGAYRIAFAWRASEWPQPVCAGLTSVAAPTCYIALAVAMSSQLVTNVAVCSSLVTFTGWKDN